MQKEISKLQKENLLWIILATDKNQKLENIKLDDLNNLAQSNNYNAKFVILTNNKVLPSIDCQTQTLLKTELNYSIKIYDKSVKVNTQIMKELKDVSYDKVMVTNALYCNKLTELSQMLEKSTQKDVDIVHLYKKRLGFYGELTNLTKALYNKVVKLFTNGMDKFYVRNCVIFNKLVLQIMQDFPNKSGAIRETTLVVGVNTEMVEVDNKFKTARLNIGTFSQLTASIGVCVLAIAMFVIICAVRMDIETLLWLIVVFVALAVAGVIFLNYSILKEKIRIDNFNIEKTNQIIPLYSQSFNDKNLVDEKMLNDKDVDENKKAKTNKVKAKDKKSATKSNKKKSEIEEKSKGTKAVANKSKETKKTAKNSKKVAKTENL